MNQNPTESLQKPVEPTQPTGIARRRLLRAGLAATPVILTLSGRSAMAQTGTCSGLSEPTYNSLVQTDGSCRVPSHTVPRSANLGQNPDIWKTNTTNDDGNIGKTKFKNAMNSGNIDTKIFRILDASTTSYEAHFCVAYCNAFTYSDYAITVPKLQYLYQNRKFGPSSPTLLEDDIKAFLKQTWGG